MSRTSVATFIWIMKRSTSTAGQMAPTSKFGPELKIVLRDILQSEISCSWERSINFWTFEYFALSVVIGAKYDLSRSIVRTLG